MSFHPPPASARKKRPEPDEEENAKRAIRRAKSTLRRYAVHNEIRHMPTLTFRHAPEDDRQITAAMRAFRQRILRAPWGPSEAFPYAWVIERGSNGTRRLHVHMGVNWWDEHGCVEVCDECATPKLREIRDEIPPAGSACWGCLWGHGFVGAPTEGNGNPRLLAQYVSKYVSKEFSTHGPGRHRYRAGEGFQPVPVRIEGTTFGQVLGQVERHMGTFPDEVIALHEKVEEWNAPPTWALQWEVA